MTSTADDTSRKALGIDGVIMLVLGAAFMLYPIYAVMTGSPVVRLLGIMERFGADVPVFLRVFFSLAPHFLSIYSLIFLFGVLTIGSTLAARRGSDWAVRTVRIAGWIIGAVCVSVFGFWCVTALAAPEATALLFAVEGARGLVTLCCVGVLVLFFVLISLGIALRRMKRRWQGE